MFAQDDGQEQDQGEAYRQVRVEIGLYKCNANGMDGVVVWMVTVGWLGGNPALLLTGVMIGPRSRLEGVLPSAIDTSTALTAQD